MQLTMLTSYSEHSKSMKFFTSYNTLACYTIQEDKKENEMWGGTRVAKWNPYQFSLDIEFNIQLDIDYMPYHINDDNVPCTPQASSVISSASINEIINESNNEPNNRAKYNNSQPAGSFKHN
ncbi:2369_t:CDS:2 [Cetraspora pellucida]|uniref:2369_t:CDS:1 n=1 Tax=Cetraspora pellucida TaxID=1433469 RepID=A0ACA9KDH8_9GLOM|nr:2369_t:CDS:2 [Cetraspora pellucida]